MQSHRSTFRSSSRCARRNVDSQMSIGSPDTVSTHATEACGVPLPSKPAAGGAKRFFRSVTQDRSVLAALASTKLAQILLFAVSVSASKYAHGTKYVFNKEASFFKSTALPSLKKRKTQADDDKRLKGTACKFFSLCETEGSGVFLRVELPDTAQTKGWVSEGDVDIYEAGTELVTKSILVQVPNTKSVSRKPATFWKGVRVGSRRDTLPRKRNGTGTELENPTECVVVKCSKTNNYVFVQLGTAGCHNPDSAKCPPGARTQCKRSRSRCHCRAGVAVGPHCGSCGMKWLDKGWFAAKHLEQPTTPSRRLRRRLAEAERLGGY